MTTTIALAGKGGTGKTALAALLIRHLAARRRGAILAIDADPAANLHQALGLQPTTTVGEIREELLARIQAGNGISRREFLEIQVRRAVEEAEAVDLLVMGRPEGPGCYCAVNHMLRQIIDSLTPNYAYVVIDNEAGMEHLSRRTTRDVDFLLVVSDPTMRSLKTAAGMIELAGRLQIKVSQTLLVINRADGNIPPELQRMVETIPARLAGIVPADRKLAEFDIIGRPLVELENDSPAVAAVETLAQQLP